MEKENFTTVMITSAAVYKPEKGIVSDSQYLVLQYVVFSLGMTFSFCGVITNGINIKTFLAIGTEDAFVVSLIALSISDFFYTAASFALSTGIFLTVFEIEYGIALSVNPFVIMIFSSSIAMTMYAVTEMTTTYLAVVRCLCVARPLHFKNLLTRSRSIFFHIAFTIFAASWYLPILSQMGTIKALDPFVNKTRIVLWLSPIREEIKDVVFISFGVIISFTSKFVIVTCIIIMVYSLKKSMQFRQSATTAGDKDTSASKRLSGKELQVVQQVTLISVFYMVCAVPKVIVIIYTFFEPEFRIGRRENNFYLTNHYLSNVSEVINSASTLIIYLVYNSRFRAKLIG